MTKFVSIYANGDDGPVVTVTEAFAEGIGAEILDLPALDSRGRPLAARTKEEAEAQQAAAEEAVKATEKTPEPASSTPPQLPPPSGGRPPQSPSGDAGNN
jgi:hypothetical protein